MVEWLGFGLAIQDRYRDGERQGLGPDLFHFPTLFKGLVGCREASDRCARFNYHAIELREEKACEPAAVIQGC